MITWRETVTYTDGKQDTVTKDFRSFHQFQKALKSMAIPGWLKEELMIRREASIGYDNATVEIKIEYSPNKIKLVDEA